MSSRITRTLTVAAFAASLAACSSVPLNEGGNGSAGGSNAASAGQVMDPFNPQSPLAQQRSVFFDFDAYVVKDEYRPMLEMHANYLTGHTSQKIRIEGNTDARGSAEYNLALGQRRSDAVVRVLSLMGVSANQMEAISYGKERPKATGTTEADYAENRRADLDYLR